MNMSCLNNNSKKLYDIVEKVLRSFGSIASAKNISFQNNVPSNLGSVNGNSDIIMLLLVNLIDNAIKYNYQEGLIEVGANAKAMELEVWVKDTGMGIPNELYNKIFERKYRHNGHKKGNGIGLSVAKTIINFYGGKIWVESEVGKGSTFVFTVPN